MTDDLIAFLSERFAERERQLDEDERVASEATPGPWRVDASPVSDAADVHAHEADVAVHPQAGEERAVVLRQGRQTRPLTR